MRIWMSLSLGLIMIYSPLTLNQSRGQESTPSWEFQGPNGRINNTLNLFTQKITGLHTYQERLDFELEGSVTNTVYTARAIPWSWLRIMDSRGGLPRKPRAFFELKEGWVERASPDWDIRVGNQIFAWGTADQINPTDVWNPRDFYDPFQSYKLPVFAARIRIHPQTLENFSFEIIGAPFFKESVLPIAFPDDASTYSVSLDSSRWLLPAPTTLQTGGLTFPLRYESTAATYPASWQLGAKLQAMRLGGWDFSLSGYSGVENLPRFAITRRGVSSDPTLPVIITLHPLFHRQSMLGLDGAGSISPFDVDIGTRFEAAYIWRSNSRALSAPTQFQQDLIRDDYIHAVLGADHTFKKKILGTVLYTNLQFVYYQRIGGNEQRPGEFVVEGLPLTIPWDRNIVWYLEDRIGNQLKVTSQFIYSFQNVDGMFTPAVKYQWTDNLQTTLSGDVFYGRETGFFGQFKDNKRVNLGVGYVF